jgi:hypothetical protein
LVLHLGAVVASRQAHDLDIDQDLAFAQRSWRIQRAAWLGMGVVLLLALAGVFGSGPLSRSDASLPGFLRLQYQRFARHQAPQVLIARLEPAATRAGEVRLWVDRQYLDDSKVDTITPPPSRVEAAADRLVYVFSTRRPGEPVTIVFTLQSERIGLSSGRVGLDDAEGFVPFRQFVYP